MPKPETDEVRVDTADSDEFQKAMLQRAVEQLEHIVHDKSSKPTQQLKNLKNLAKTACLICRLQLHEDVAKLQRQLDECLAPRPRPNWQARYNGACFHARRIDQIPVGQILERKQAVNDALKQLTLVFSKAASQSDSPELTPAMRDWLDHDPDLALIQSDPL